MAMPSIPETGAGTTSEGSFSRSASSYSFIRQEQKSQRHGVWSELGRLVQNAWPGYGSIGIFLVVGYCTCHETGPSVLVSILIGGISCIISGCCLTELVTRPLAKNEGIANVFQVLGKVPFFILMWLDIQIHIGLLAICSRSLTATVDKTTDHQMHDFVLQNFGLTPFLGTFPDFVAGGAVMIPALFVACGFEHSKTLNGMINIITGLGFALVTSIGFYSADAKIFGNQPILLHGSKGVLSSIGLISILLSGSGSTLCLSHLSRLTTSEGPRGPSLDESFMLRATSIPSHLLIMLANGFSQIGLILGFLAIGLVLPFVANMSPLGLLPEVPILQAFESDIGHGWMHLLMATLIIIALSLNLLQLTIPLHEQVQSLVKEGLLFPWLSKSIPHHVVGEAPFLGSVVVGCITALVTTLGDINHLLLSTALARILLDLFICIYTILARYGLIVQCLDQSFSITTTQQRDRRRSSTRNPGTRARSSARNIRRQLKRKRKEQNPEEAQERTMRITVPLTDFGASRGPSGSPCRVQGTTALSSSSSMAMILSRDGAPTEIGFTSSYEPQCEPNVSRNDSMEDLPLPGHNTGPPNHRLRFYFQKLMSVAWRRGPPPMSRSGAQFSGIESQSSLEPNFLPTNSSNPRGPLELGEKRTCQNWSSTLVAKLFGPKKRRPRGRRGEDFESDESSTSLESTDTSEGSNHSDYGTDSQTSDESSSPCDSSSSTSSDTDIDSIVEHYAQAHRQPFRRNDPEERQSPQNIATISTRPSFHSYDNILRRNKRNPSLTTFYRMFIALVLILVCLLLQILVFNTLSVAAYPNVIIFNLILSMLVLPMFVFISRQPQDWSPDLNGEATQFRVPFCPWLPFLSIFINLHVSSTLIPRAWGDLALWSFLGALLYGVCSSKDPANERRKMRKRKMGTLLEAIVHRPQANTQIFDLPRLHGFQNLG